MCVKSGVERPVCKIGAMATDDEAYKTFGDLFMPIIKDLHSDYDQRYSYKFEELRPDVVDDTISEIMLGVSKITDFKIEVHRNFR